jgi:endonuclease
VITMGTAIREYVQSVGGKVTSDQIKKAVFAKYPDNWKESTFGAYMYAVAVNNPKAYIHHSFTEKFLFRNPDSTVEIYSEEVHGPNVWTPGNEETEANDVATLIETSISLESDTETHLVNHLSKIESGLRFVDRQVSTEVGRIDILAEDATGSRVVIEIKVGEAKDAAVGQIARYLGWYGHKDGKPPRGILIAAEFPEGVRYAANAIQSLSLLAYKVQFSFERAVI